MLSIFVCFAVLVSCTSVRCFPSLRDASWPADLVSPFSYPTPSPIDINTCEVRLVNTTVPLNVVASQNVLYYLKNTGSSLELINSCPDLFYLSGSIFGASKYLFEKLEFFWASSYLGVSSSKIDGVGSPLKVRAYLRNAKYDNKTAYLHRDGFLVVSININVEGKAPNPLFKSFSEEIKCVTKPSSIQRTFTLSYFFWFDQFLTTPRFYAYPGSIDKYDCATVIQGPKSLGPYISIPQFEVFRNLRDLFGKPYTRVSPSYPSNGRPVVEVCGVRQQFPII